MWEHEARILSGELKELAPFLALLQEQPDPAIIDKQKELLGQVDDAKLQSDLLALALVIDARSFGYDVVLEKFKKEVNMLKETSIVQEWLDESYKAGEIKARSKESGCCCKRNCCRDSARFRRKFCSGSNLAAPSN